MFQILRNEKAGTAAEVLLVLVDKDVETRKIKVAKMIVWIGVLLHPIEKIFALVLRIAAYKQALGKVEQMFLAMYVAEIFGVLNANDCNVGINCKILIIRDK